MVKMLSLSFRVRNFLPAQIREQLFIHCIPPGLATPLEPLRAPQHLRDTRGPHVTHKGRSQAPCWEPLCPLRLPGGHSRPSSGHFLPAPPGPSWPPLRRRPPARCRCCPGRGPGRRRSAAAPTARARGRAGGEGDAKGALGCLAGTSPWFSGSPFAVCFLTER